MPEHAFKAEIQGQFTLTHEGKKLPNYSARANYDDYAIGDGIGNRDGRLGIKLGQLPHLSIIDAFNPRQPPNHIPQPKDTSMPKQFNTDNDKGRTIINSDTDTMQSTTAKAEPIPLEQAEERVSADQLSQIAQALQLLLPTSPSTPLDSQPTPPPAKQKQTRRAKSAPHSPSSKPQA